MASGTLLARLHPALPALLDNRTELELRRRVEAARAAEGSRRCTRRSVARSRRGTQARREAERSRQLAESKPSDCSVQARSR